MPKELATARRRRTTAQGGGEACVRRGVTVGGAIQGKEHEEEAATQFRGGREAGAELLGLTGVLGPR